MRPGLGLRGPVPSCDHGSRSKGKSGRPATYQASGGWERRVVLRAVVQGRLTLRDPSLAGHDTPRPHERQSFGGSDTVRLAGEGPPALPCLLYHGVSRGEGEKVGSCWVFMVAGIAHFAPVLEARGRGGFGTEVPKQRGLLGFHGGRRGWIRAVSRGAHGRRGFGTEVPKQRGLLGFHGGRRGWRCAVYGGSGEGARWVAGMVLGGDG